MSKPELLAPVGCEENFYAAVNYGASAVYIGLSDFSARKNAGNFTLERLPYILAYAHLFGVKVYVAVNTVVKNGELNDYFDTIKQAYLCGVDAFIVQDLFLGRILKNKFPDICLHLSTQAGINNLDGAKLAASYGFTRVILARETSIGEIKKIAAFIETEVFVHGALCTCFSGHCYFSSFVGGKSGNRGLCRQPCRKVYKYLGKGIKDDYRFALSLSDLALHKKVQELISSGVKSFKIEGRMRSFEYVCASCDFYSNILNGVFDGKKYDALLKTYNRGGCSEGLSFGQDGRLISDKIQNHCGVAVGTVASIKGVTVIPTMLKKNIAPGDCFKIVNGVEKGNCVAVQGAKGVVLKFKGAAAPGDELRITKDIGLIDKFNDRKKLFTVKARLVARIGEKPVLYINDTRYEGNFICEKALTSSVTKSEIKDNLRKTDVYPFAVEPSCEIDSQMFILKRNLNELRSKAYYDYFYSFALNREKRLKINDIYDDSDNYYVKHDDFSTSKTVIASDFSFLKSGVFDNLVFCPSDYNDDGLFENFFNLAQKTTCRNGNRVKTFLYVPPFLNSADEGIIANRSERFDGLYCESASSLFLAKRLGKIFFGGVELNVTNKLTYSEIMKEGANLLAVSKELSYSEISNMPSSGCVLAGGSVKIMSLEYCPFSKKCAECRRGDCFILKDYDGREFPVRRYKLSSCRFEIYNCLPLKSEVRFNNEIYDFTMLSPSEAGYFISLAKSSGSFKTDAKGLSFTSGNFKKGVE